MSQISAFEPDYGAVAKKRFYLSKLSNKAILGLLSKDPRIAQASGWSHHDLKTVLQKRGEKLRAWKAKRISREAHKRAVAQRIELQYTSLITVPQWNDHIRKVVIMIADLAAAEYQRCWKSTRRAVTRLKRGGLGRWQLPYHAIPLVAFWQFCAKLGGEDAADAKLLRMENKIYLRRAIIKGVQDIKPRTQMAEARKRDRRIASAAMSERLRAEFGEIA